jgi:REP element-mobilizing transposase RayT
LKVYGGVNAVYHCMTRTVNGERLFKDREKEILRKMLWQVADFSGVEVLTYCVMSNHFHVLVRVPDRVEVSDKELLRRYKVLYPQPTKYQTASLAVMEKELAKGGDEAAAMRQQLLARMGDVSEYMKTLKQRFSFWYNRSHERFGTLWAERFKSVLVEGKGNPLQTMAAYIDLNPVRAGIVEDPKDYRFCGYAEAVAHSTQSTCSRLRQGSSEQAGQTARSGICYIWRAYADGAPRERFSVEMALQAHRELIFGKLAGDARLSETDRKKALKVLEKEDAVLPKTTVLRCRVRYFSDGAILGSKEFVRGFVGTWQLEKGRKYPPKVNPLRGADWQNLATIQGLRKQVFG